MEVEASVALEQAESEEYGEDILGYEVSIYGIAFWKKKALVKTLRACR
ncbi:MAG: hypothetical protein IAA97_07390 [Spirochaetes bacterium]|uniref:Uncharacterized protein n=1 Tax=Candidatus Ornithospirochaeta stercoripullorum TaxID=2840899 RepID=A0A9D9E158_9SPIO|nr:hypothetical protein [Candidatus Ornithospirochaeta stercoripullorum]